MPKFSYRIQNENSEIIEGVLEAANEAVAQKYLTDNKYHVLSLKLVKQRTNFKKFFERFNRVNTVQLNFFVRQMATMLKAGVPMLASLATLQEGVKDDVLRKAIGDIHDNIEKGNSFSDSIARHPAIFNPLFLSTVRSGEAIGEIDTILLRLADILERDYQTQTKLKAAMRYPIFAMCSMIAAFLVATLFIIPRFRNLFESMGAELPLPTLILLTMSELLLNFWYIAAVIVIGAVVGVMYHYKTKSGRRFWDRIMLKVPVFGTFVKDAVFARFSRMLGLMLRSGVNILQGLDLIAEIVDNSVISDEILRIKEHVEQGDSMASQMRVNGLFPPLLVQIVQVGEESGKMDELLTQISEFYDAELEVMAKNMETLIEPIFIVVLAVFVLIMALGIFLPMWNMFSVIQQAAM